ncbi:MAG TPA: glycosyl hydrolase [Puia sp.]|uniref:glycosyl hydrolase n=1 Tax=Puia sp. TaxID=2045100 RepID=UPI002B79CC59|nr:glycosyl hydrolase [Puia sp.]HVU98290.1 glycosyl hydrolase [Puia sp.]
MRSPISIILLLLCTNATAQQAPDPKQFLNPPVAAKPWVFWYWMNAAVSKEGLHADLLAMKSAGIGGAYLMPINGATNPPQYTPITEQLSPRWWEMVRYAMQQADSLGLQLAMHACDGFAVAGGPWITPALSMQKIVSSRITLYGGKHITKALPQPPALENYYKDIAVFAFPTPAAWDDTARKGPLKCEDSCHLDFTFDKPFTCRSIIIHSTNNYQSNRLLIQTSDDGEHFHDIGRLIPPRHGWQDGDAPITHSIPTTTARYFRFIYDKTGSEPGAEDLDAAKWKPVLKLTAIELSAAPAINQFEGKSGEVWRIGLPANDKELPASLCIPQSKLINITAYLDKQGHLDWQAPPGHWTILRIGQTSTGHTNATGGGAKGLECDKFNPEAIKLQFDRWFGEAIRQAGPELASRVLKIFHVDSWECGSQNWSPVFRAEFKKRRGYDLLNYLPAMTGVPIGSAEESEKFLHDIRQTIAELIHDQFYVTLANLAHAHGCTFSAECVAPTMTGDDLLHYSAVDIPMGEFWLRSPTHDKPNDILDAISGGHLYGKNIIQAEAFTELREAWDETPAMLKTLQDRNYALGINRLVLHVFVHNPWMDRKPGMTLGGVGTYLQRDQTWWPLAKGWIDYTTRCQWLLQQGRPVADIAVFTGEEIPRRAWLPERLTTILPGLIGADRITAETKRLENKGEPTTKQPNGVVHSANMADPADWTDPLHGYAFDSFNPDALFRLATVHNGRIELPGGASYACLVVPGPTSPAAAKRLAQLKSHGATILYAPVTHLNIRPDLTALKNLAYTHRTGPGFDIYFISNPSDHQFGGLVTCRITGRAPELWDPLTGSVDTALQYNSTPNNTLVRLTLEGHQSIFLVFRRKAATPKQLNATIVKTALKTGPWTIRFDTIKTVTTDTLFDWSQRSDTTIRYYSGLAVYTTTFEATPTQNPAFLDLGHVADIAKVTINNIDVGTVWTSNKLEITKALHPGVNTLKVTVANTWANRLHHTGLPAGLLGPLTLSVHASPSP